MTTTWLVVAIPLGLWLASCWLWPYRKCTAMGCKGGKRYSPLGMHWADCRSCGGRGKHVRRVSRMLGRT